MLARRTYEPGFGFQRKTACDESSSVASAAVVQPVALRRSSSTLAPGRAGVTAATS
jgi:hypothetical protein